ncbi:ShlB/FhaC/HecB family hemolysin secretion/activation protein [Pararhizobium sp.]|uniref:ShlB/FhaC/HecB family hemolysin secretion/activation protein n=1 Tax=Pararhizobium sp. TaxID=1977563 RepID=UPI0027242E9D|nr:ShlB/FhaC/HecB family hemolysin secretion/activation protein [Pararhizobium sp.]MDO9415817.1 ShlB/FhaC/HecB family hemolysin secretion/activation protein [Pararhizobium sp.]
MAAVLSLAGEPASAQTQHSGRDEPVPVAIATVTDGKSGRKAACFAVDWIRIEGHHDLVERASLEEAARPFARSCQNQKSVSGLLQALSGVFADRGFVTTRALLPEQDIAESRQLIVRIVPGRIDKVVYKEERKPYRGPLPRMAALGGTVLKSGSLGDLAENARAWFEGLDDELESLTLLPESARIAVARTIAPDDVVQVDGLQDTLDSLNRVASNKAKADLAPGRRPATSEVRITNRIEDAFRLYAGYDTDSVEGVDKLRFGVTMEKDNLLGINDSWDLTLKSGIDTNQLTGGVSVSVGRATLRARGDWSENTAELGPLQELFTTTWNVSAGADYILHSARTQSLVADVTVTHREENRYYNGLFALTDQRVSALETGLTYNRFYEQGSISARVASTLGLPVFNARVDPGDLGRDTPRSQFAKLDATLAGSYVIPGKASLSSSLSAQWSADPLHSDDQMTIGSRASVRGFSSGGFKADSGVVWRNEAAFSLQGLLPDVSGKDASGGAAAVVSRLNPYVFLDAGFGHDIPNDTNGYRVSSGGGLRYGGPLLSLDVGYALRLLSDRATRRAGGEAGELFVTLRAKVF